MDIWILKLGMWMSRSLVRLPTFGDKVSVLVFRNIDRHTVTSCRRCACIERAVCEKKKKKRKKKSQFTVTLLNSGFAHTSNLSSSKSNWFLNIRHRLVVSSIHWYHPQIRILDLINAYIRWRVLAQVEFEQKIKLSMSRSSLFQFRYIFYQWGRLSLFNQLRNAGRDFHGSSSEIKGDFFVTARKNKKR